MMENYGSSSYIYSTKNYFYASCCEKIFQSICHSMVLHFNNLHKCHFVLWCVWSQQMELKVNALSGCNIMLTLLVHYLERNQTAMILVFMLHSTWCFGKMHIKKITSSDLSFRPFLIFVLVFEYQMMFYSMHIFGKITHNASLWLWQGSHPEQWWGVQRNHLSFHLWSAPLRSSILLLATWTIALSFIMHPMSLVLVCAYPMEQLLQ